MGRINRIAPRGVCSSAPGRDFLGTAARAGYRVGSANGIQGIGGIIWMAPSRHSKLHSPELFLFVVAGLQIAVRGQPERLFPTNPGPGVLTVNSTPIQSV